MTRLKACRRKHPRFPLVDRYRGSLAFPFPDRNGSSCRMELLDLSRGGLSFILAHELPGLEVGESIDGAEVELAGRLIRGDLLVMHLTPEATAGAICGALFFPAEDEDLLMLRSILAELEAQVPILVGGA